MSQGKITFETYQTRSQNKQKKDCVEKDRKNNQNKTTSIRKIYAPCIV